jgi:hypothetical protein
VQKANCLSTSVPVVTRSYLKNRLCVCQMLVQVYVGTRDGQIDGRCFCQRDGPPVVRGYPFRHGRVPFRHGRVPFRHGRVPFRHGRVPSRREATLPWRKGDPGGRVDLHGGRGVGRVPSRREVTAFAEQ